MEASAGIPPRHALLSAPAVVEAAVVVMALAGFLGGVYAAVVFGGGRALGLGAHHPLLWITATAAVAVSFRGVRDRARRFASRLLFGARQRPDHVLAELSLGMAGSYPTEEALPEMARIVAQGSGAAGARVWLRLGPKMVPAAAWPAGPSRVGPVALDEDDTTPPPLPEAHHTFAVHDRGALIGAITVVLGPAESLSPVDIRLLEDMSSQAGLVLRNVRLTEELASSLEAISRQAADLRASRQRIVEAQDAERRRVERDIHDGAQQHLVALMVQLRVFRTMVDRDPAKAVTVAGIVRDLARGALENLGDLARGIYPRALTDHGVAPALERQIATAGLPVEVRDEGSGRYRAEVEAAVYFACLEAVQNVAKHAPGAGVVITLTEDAGQLRFAVVDDGNGFDPEVCPPGSGLGNMRDRLAALGGSLEIESSVGRGTKVTGRVPV